jgi:hypothetical protein
LYQCLLDDDSHAKQLEKFAKLEKENKKMKIELLKATKDSGKSAFRLISPALDFKVFPEKASLGDSNDGFESEDPLEVAPFEVSSSVSSPYLWHLLTSSLARLNPFAQVQYKLDYDRDIEHMVRISFSTCLLIIY